MLNFSSLIKKFALPLGLIIALGINSYYAYKLENRSSSHQQIPNQFTGPGPKTNFNSVYRVQLKPKPYSHINGKPYRSELKVPENCISVENFDGYLRCTRTSQEPFKPAGWSNPKPGYKYISSGPIWSNNDAPNKCNDICPDGYSWNGQWRNASTVRSICECAPEHRFATTMTIPTENSAYSGVRVKR